MTILHRLGAFFRRKAPGKDQPIRSVVLLLQEPIRPKQEDLRMAIFRAWGCEIGVTDEDKADKGLLVAADPTSLIIQGDTFFAINSFARRYFDTPKESVNSIPDLRQRRVVLENKAWFSVDVIRPDNPSADERTALYRKMARLAAEFLSPNCLGVHLPETGVLRAHDDELATAMRSEDPLQAIRNFPYVPVVEAPDQAALDAAVAEARRRWPEFVEAFHSRTPDALFSAKAPFEDGKYCEWMWINVISIVGNRVTGELGNTPVNVKNLHEGDLVHIVSEEIGDWIYVLGDGTKVGGFSIPLLLNDSEQ